MNLLQIIAQENLRTDLPSFRPGDTLEGTRKSYRGIPRAYPVVRRRCYQTSRRRHQRYFYSS